MLKLKSDSNLIEQLKGSKSSLWLIGLLALGVVFILLGSGVEVTQPTVDEEARVSEMCSLMDGVGECRVMMTYSPDDDSRVYAVLVLCDGADSVTVREKITSLFCSLYGIGSHRVEIQRLNKQNE